MLSCVTGRIEQCEKTKARIRLLCPGLWIHYVIGGKGYYHGEPMERGDAFIVYEKDLCDYVPDADDPWRYVWLRLAGEDSEGLLAACGLPRQSGRFSFSYADKLEAVCAPLLCDSSDSILKCSSSFAEGVAKTILSLHRIDQAPAESSEGERWVSAAKAYIHAHYHKPIHIEELAASLHIDRKYLRNLFVRHTGQSTQAYLLSVRIARAKELLDDTDTPIGIIASSVGYEDPLCFSRIFKKHVGLSPSAYRASKNAYRNKADNE